MKLQVLKKMTAKSYTQLPLFNTYLIEMPHERKAHLSTTCSLECETDAKVEQRSCILKISEIN